MTYIYDIHVLDSCRRHASVADAVSHCNTFLIDSLDHFSGCIGNPVKTHVNDTSLFYIYKQNVFLFIRY